MHRERLGSGGEKLIEVRLEEIEPMEASLDLGIMPSSDSDGLVTILLERATPEQMSQLLETVRCHPGNFEVAIQIQPQDELAPISLPYTVSPTNGFVGSVRQVVQNAEVDVMTSPTIGPRKQSKEVSIPN